MIMMYIPVLSALADEKSEIVQAYINNENIKVFLKEEVNPESLSIKVANRNTDNLKSGRLSDESATIYTTILVDTSKSIPKAARKCVIEFVQAKIKDISPNEKLRIVAFGSENKVLQDFTHDRYDLSNSVDAIEFNSSQSMIYDAIYQTIPQFDNADELRFSHTLVITDGADKAAQGITKEELYMRLRDESYPITSVRVAKEQTDSVSKTLSALSRISGGNYIELYPEADYSSLLSQIDIGNYVWASADVEAELLDGSTRQVDISDGVHSYSCDMKMSVAENNSIASTIEPTAESLHIDSEPWIKSISLETVLIVAMIIVIICATIVIIVSLVKGRDKNSSGTANEPSAPERRVTPNADETEFYSGNEQYPERYTIKLSSRNNASLSWTIDVVKEIVIGRGEDCTIKIQDGTVSHRQCEIAVHEQGLVLTNLSRSNVTKLNGYPVGTGALISPGDIIKMGRATLSVDYIKRVGEELPDSARKNYVPGDETESLF